jgi:hypothetical protein
VSDDGQDWRQLAHIERELQLEAQRRREAGLPPQTAPIHRPGFFGKPLIKAGRTTILNRWVFLALPLALLLLLGLRNNDTFAPLWGRSLAAGVVLLPASPALRWLAGKAIGLAVFLAIIVGIGLVLRWWSFTLFGHHL